MKIELKNISKKYGKNYALKNFNTCFESGVYGLLGANGAGKTTLINIFVGILKGDEGDVYIDGKNCRELKSDFLSLIGYLPQYPKFYKDFSVYDFLEYICVLKDIKKELINDTITGLLKEVYLEDAKDKKIGALSGGMRQRVGIAQAMVNDPKILILDEPTAGLDPRERIRFRNLISKFAKNRTVLLATHIVSDIEFIANKVIILKNGEIIKEDTPKNLQNQISDKVYLLELEDSADLSHYDHLKISNIQRNDDKLLLRIISDDKPSQEAKNTNPNLEDVFLYFN